MTRWWLSNAANSVQMGGDASQMLHIPCTCRVWGEPYYHWEGGDPGYIYIYIQTYTYTFYSFIPHAARVQAERCPAKTACAVYQKREKIEPKAL